jgi:hypothetical protein
MITEERDTVEAPTAWVAGPDGLTVQMKAEPGRAKIDLNAALAMLQGMLPDVRKGDIGTVKGVTKDGRPFEYDYRYASLADVTAAIMPLLSRCGLSFTAVPQVLPSGYALVCQLRHVSGEMIEGHWPLPGQGSPQMIGGHMTYGRRYMLCSMTGVAADEDDDADGQQPARPRQKAEPSSRQTAKATAAKGEAATARKAKVDEIVAKALAAKIVEPDLREQYEAARGGKLLNEDVQAFEQDWKLGGLLNYLKETLEADA